MSWWLFNYDALDQSLESPESPANQQMAVEEEQSTQSKVKDIITDQNEDLPSTEVPQLDDDIAEFKYRNLKRLMSTRIDTLDEYQLGMVVQQIVNELPEMVSMGKMHPFDATFAHTQAMAKQDLQLQAFEVEAIKQNYMDLYPFRINSGMLDLH